MLVEHFKDLPPQEPAREPESKRAETKKRPRGVARNLKIVKEVKEEPVSTEEAPEHISSEFLAHREGVTIEDYQKNLHTKINKMEAEYLKKFEEARPKKTEADLEKNTEKAYEILNYLESENRPDRGLLNLDTGRLWFFLNKADQLRAESRNFETNEIYLRLRISAVDATLALIYEICEKENVFSAGKSIKVWLAKHVGGKRMRAEAENIEKVQHWASKAYADSRKMVHGLRDIFDKLTPEEQKIVESLEIALDSLRGFVR